MRLFSSRRGAPQPEGLAQYLMILFERVAFAVVNAEGLGAEITALCALLRT